MTLYLVKHGEEDYKLHREGGEVIAGKGWIKQPSEMEMVEALADEHSGASILGDPDARWEYTEIVTGEVAYLDVAEHGESEVPFELS